MKIAVIGAGIFGVTAALHLAKSHDVDLYEKQDKILSSASMVNQYRIHQGYHYPRSPETVHALQKSVADFYREYGDAINSSCDHYYFIANEKSKTSPKQFVKFCDKFGLPYEFRGHPLVRNVDLGLKVKEDLIDPFFLRALCEKRLQNSSVNVFLGAKFERDQIDEAGYDFIVNCTYANLNELAKEQKEYQYELCEKIVVALPEDFKNQSLVIVDGPFMCLDPMGTTGNHVLGNVVHAIHQDTVGHFPDVMTEDLEAWQKFSGKNLLNNGVQHVPEVSKFKDFINAAEHFIPRINAAVYVGSMFTVRTVLPNLDDTDARLTMVERQGKIINVFSGKIDTCVVATQEVSKLIGEA